MRPRSVADAIRAAAKLAGVRASSHSLRVGPPSAWPHEAPASRRCSSPGGGPRRTCRRTTPARSARSGGRSRRSAPKTDARLASRATPSIVGLTSVFGFRGPVAVIVRSMRPLPKLPAFVLLTGRQKAVGGREVRKGNLHIGFTVFAYEGSGERPVVASLLLALEHQISYAPLFARRNVIEPARIPRFSGLPVVPPPPPPTPLP